MTFFFAAFARGEAKQSEALLALVLQSAAAANPMSVFVCACTSTAGACGAVSHSSKCAMSNGERVPHLGCTLCHHRQCLDCVELLSAEPLKFLQHHRELRVDQNITPALRSCLNGSAVAAARARDGGAPLPSMENEAGLVYDAAQGILRFTGCPLCTRDPAAAADTAAAAAGSSNSPPTAEHPAAQEDNTAAHASVVRVPALKPLTSSRCCHECRARPLLDQGLALLMPNSSLFFPHLLLPSPAQSEGSAAMRVDLGEAEEDSMVRVPALEPLTSSRCCHECRVRPLLDQGLALLMPNLMPNQEPDSVEDKEDDPDLVDDWFDVLIGEDRVRLWLGTTAWAW